jgi:biotin synthase
MKLTSNELVDRSLSSDSFDRPEREEILHWPDDQLDELIEAAHEVRLTHFDNDVHLKFLMNAKSGLCPEDCHYCSQSAISDADIEKYSWRSAEELMEGAQKASELGSSRYCIVASGRGPSDQEIEYLEEVVPEIKEQYGLDICVCLGLLNEEHAQRLADAGVDIVNHNLNTGPDYYEEICTTHTFEDRVNTLENVKKAGMRPCSGGIVGQGESDRDIVDLAGELADQEPEIVPMNFLIPVPGTPMEDEGNISTEKALKTLCLIRFVLPDSDLTISAGREWHLGPAQEKALKVGSSLFIGGYLTTKGEEVREDLDMIEEAGFEIAGQSREKILETLG